MVLCMFVCIIYLYIHAQVTHAVSVCLWDDYTVFLSMMTAARTSDAKTSIIKLLHRVHLGRWDPNTSCTSGEKDPFYLYLSHARSHFSTPLWTDNRSIPLRWQAIFSFLPFSPFSLLSVKFPSVSLLISYSITHETDHLDSQTAQLCCHCWGHQI